MPPPDVAQVLRQSLNDVHTSMRRYYLDEFHFRHVAKFPTNWQILDLGGHKIKDRGFFDCADYHFQTIILNLSQDMQPDVQGDAYRLPFADESLDAIICSEMLEHVLDPIPILIEANRVLKAGGILLLCVPFLYRTHAEPYDYARYTDYYWRATLSEQHFTHIEIERQGLYWSVLIDMLREVLHRNIQADLIPSWQQAFYKPLIAWMKRTAFHWDARSGVQNHRIMRGYTTGYGIICYKD